MTLNHCFSCLFTRIFVIYPHFFKCTKWTRCRSQVIGSMTTSTFWQHLINYRKSSNFDNIKPFLTNPLRKKWPFITMLSKWILSHKSSNFHNIKPKNSSWQHCIFYPQFLRTLYVQTTVKYLFSAWNHSCCQNVNVVTFTRAILNPMHSVHFFNP